MELTLNIGDGETRLIYKHCENFCGCLVKSIYCTVFKHI